MKVRNDYVSNSSSCSFIVHVKTDNDVKAIRKLYEKVDAAYSFSLENDGWFRSQDIQSIDDFRPHTFVCVDIGEDHDSWYEDRFNKALDEFRKEPKLHLYSDPDAHLTVYDAKIKRNMKP